MNKSYLKFSHCCLSALNQVFSHCMSTVHQCSKHLQSTAVIVSDEGIFSPSETCGSTYLLYIYFKPLTVFELKEGLLVVGINTCKTKTTSDKGFWITLFRYDFVWRAPSTFRASTPASLAYMQRCTDILNILTAEKKHNAGCEGRSKNEVILLLMFLSYVLKCMACKLALHQ